MHSVFYFINLHELKTVPTVITPVSKYFYIHDSNGAVYQLTRVIYAHKYTFVCVTDSVGCAN